MFDNVNFDNIVAMLDDFKALIAKFADMINALVAGFKKEYVVETTAAAATDAD